MVVGLTAVAGYVIDAAGFGVQPWAALAAGVVGAAMVAVSLPRQDDAGVADLAAWLGIVLFMTAMLLRLSWPSLMLPGRGPDLAHHLLLVDYIEQQGHLVHDRSLSGAMGEMAHYTPAAHLLAVMAGRWFDADGLRAFFPLVTICAALTAGFVFLIARRLVMALPFAVAASMLLLFPAPYFFGAFTHDAFLAQTVATLFAVAMWWAITAWHDHPTTAVASSISILLLATFLSWPVFLGPVFIVFVAMLMRGDLPLPARRRQFAVVIVPLLAVFFWHSWDRWGWMMTVGTSGAVVPPSADTLGWLLPLLATIGAMAALADGRARISVILLFVIALQSLTLFLLATAQGAHTPYIALKMVYLAIYPMAVLGALALARLAGTSRITETIGWVAATVLLIAVRPSLNAPRLMPVVDGDLQAAGKHVRSQGLASCVDYLVADAQTAYWLHLAVLGNPRSSARMAEVDQYDPRAAMAPWITAAGRSVAIADLRLLPDEVRAQVDVTAQFGHAAVISVKDAARRGVTIKGCD